MEKQKVGVKMILPYDEAISYMEDLLKSLKSGKIVVNDGEKHVTMTPGDTVGIAVEAKVKKDKQKFGFELTWADNGPAKLTISDKEPAASAVPAKTVSSAPAMKAEAKPPAKMESAKTPAKKATPKKPATKKTAAKKSK